MDHNYVAKIGRPIHSTKSFTRHYLEQFLHMQLLWHSEISGERVGAWISVVSLYLSNNLYLCNYYGHFEISGEWVGA